MVSVRRYLTLAIFISCCLAAAVAAQEKAPAAPAPDRVVAGNARAPKTESVDESSSDPLLADLYGSDEKSSFAAQSLLLAILKGERPEAAPAEQLKAKQYRKLLAGLLDRLNLANHEREIPVAEKAIAAMGYLASKDTPFPEAAEHVLPLVGIGPENLRRVVREALLSSIRVEQDSLRQQKKNVDEAPTLKKLSAKLHASLRAQGVFEEVAHILWQVDRKILITQLLEGLLKNKNGAGNPSAYVLELRGRLSIDFPTLEGWEKWWRENQGKGIETILASSRKIFQQRRVELWKRTFQRIKESANPERFLLVTNDTFELDFSREMRAAVLGELAAFPLWLRDTRFPKEMPGIGILDEAAKDKFLDRAVGLLLKILEGANSYRYVYLEIKRAAAAALPAYQSYLERKPEYTQRLSGLLLAELRQTIPHIPPLDPGPSSQDPEVLNSSFWDEGTRLYAVELIRTVGLLRLSNRDLVHHLEELIKRHLEGPPSPEVFFWRNDLELISEVVAAVGRLAQGDPEAIRLLLEIFDFHEKDIDKAWRDLRKACVTALNQPVNDTQLRGEVRKLYVNILDHPEDKSDRIPAIIGLGILAKAGDEDAVDFLLEVLDRREQFEANEITAVVDALAYLGGQRALWCFLGFLHVKDRPFSDLVWKKVVALLKGDNPQLLAWLVRQLEERSYRGQLSDHSEVLINLAKEPELQEFFSAEKLNLESAEPFLRFWECALARIRALEFLGQEEEARQRVSELGDLAVKNDKVKTYRPEVESELALLRSRIALKDKVKAALKGATLPPPEALAKVLLEVAASGGKEALDRWRNLNWILLQVQAIKASSQNALLAEQLHAALASGTAEAWWEGIPKEARERFLKNLEAARDKLKVPAAPAGG
ncbi:MAG: hypothetical protein HY717_02300 [Planctomycetes bacterium]|nr:hypothetical protein [Planctomycetota bacterium]